MKNTKEAFIWIVNVLNDNNIKFKISGGLAANSYGTKRELADIDVEVLDSDIDIIYKNVKEYIFYGPARYIDEHWDVLLMTLRYRGQEIDISSSKAKIYNKEIKKWVDKPGDIKDFSFKTIFNIEVPVETIDSLIEYKKILSRSVDIEDVRQLKKFKNNLTNYRN